MTREEKNMFRDAKFGDEFLTRNGQVMIYQKQAREDVYCLFDEESDCVIEYRPNGSVIYEYTGDAEPQEDDIVKKYVHPSLPSELDEAAEEHSKQAFNGLLVVDNIDAFKAGAEWMAGQGETQEHFVIGHIEASHGQRAIVCYPEIFEIGDNVIVQIRKK